MATATTEPPPITPADASRRTWRNPVAGLAGVAAALGSAEGLAAVLGVGLSPVGAVADAVIELTPPPLPTWMIATLGSAAKPLATLGVLAVAAVAGVLLARGTHRHRWVAAAGFVVFGALGTAALAAAGAEVLPSGAAVGLAALIGAAATTGLVLRAPAAAPTRRPDVAAPTDGGYDRRAFGRLLGAALAVGGAGVAVSRVTGPSAQVEAARESVALPSPVQPAGSPPAGAALDVDGLSPLFTPNADFFRIDTAAVIPRVDPVTWSLTIDGMVDAEQTWTYDDLLAMDQVEVDCTIACVSNEVGGRLVGNARWQGVLLADLLARTGIGDGVEQVMGRSTDGFTAGFPIEAATDGRETLVAVAMNGEPLPARHGFPARLIVPGLYGYVSATKWLTRITLTTWDEEGYWVPRGWAREGPIKVASRIDVPGGSGSIPAGTTAIAGVAWAPGRGIDRVEVEIDGDWVDAELGDALADESWRQWRVAWDAEPGRHDLRVRATTGDGETQSQDPVPPRPDGAEGWHGITVEVA